MLSYILNVVLCLLWFVSPDVFTTYRAEGRRTIIIRLSLYRGPDGIGATRRGPSHSALGMVACVSSPPRACLGAVHRNGCEIMYRMDPHLWTPGSRRTGPGVGLRSRLVCW